MWCISGDDCEIVARPLENLKLLCLRHDVVQIDSNATILHLLLTTAMSTGRIACALWLVPICTFSTPPRTCLRCFSRARNGHDTWSPGWLMSTSVGACTWRLETRREKRSRQVRGRDFIDEDLVRINRAGMSSGDKAARHGGKTLRARRHLCCRAAWCVETKAGDNVFVYMWNGCSRHLRHDRESDRRVCDRRQRLHGNSATTPPTLSSHLKQPRATWDPCASRP